MSIVYTSIIRGAVYSLSFGGLYLLLENISIPPIMKPNLKNKKFTNVIANISKNTYLFVTKRNGMCSK